ncbi:RHS domain-containing protein [Pseudomonas defluvii]|uniref:RHS domain-containing protein n=1 Tax=Pseudomonas defluvii TaxID=1876757 RepID=UPI0009F3E0EF|nr:RHS domain-containing protein [Pseudomonas defluvii]
MLKKLLCSDLLGTPQELTNQQGEIVWRAQHKGIQSLLRDVAAAQLIGNNFVRKGVAR